MPDNVFALGDSVFVVVNSFHGNVVVHIRQYNKHGERYYPTSTGITLKPDWIEYIMGRVSVPKSKRELKCGFIPEEQFRITSNNFTDDFLFERFISGLDRKITIKKIIITFSQWIEMISKYDRIASCVSEYNFQTMDFINAYMQCCEDPVVQTLSPSLDVSHGQEFALQILRDSLCQILKEGGLKQPVRIAEELWANKERTFNSFALSVDVMDFAKSFYDNLFDNQKFLLLKPVYYVTSEFLKNIDLVSVLREAKTVLCPPYTFEYFEDNEDLDF